MGRVPKCLMRLSQRASRRTTGATPYVVLHIPYVGMFLAMRTCQDRQRHLKTAVWRAESPTRERICQMRPSVLPPATGFLAILPRLSPDGTACTMRHQQLNNLQRQDNKASNPHAVIGPVRRVGMRGCCGGRAARSHHKRSYCVHLGPGPPWCASLCPTVRYVVHALYQGPGYGLDPPCMQQTDSSSRCGMNGYKRRT